VTQVALWPYALELYGRPGAEPLLLTLQDAHGQCVPLLLWAAWLAASGRPAERATLERGAALARAWEDAAIAPLRGLRRRLKRPAGPGSPSAREQLRRGAKALELDAERMLLQMLDELSPAPAEDAVALGDMLALAASAWGREAPPELLDRLAELA
jgi:uncharacterized protein (TIGR02444 family)